MDTHSWQMNLTGRKEFLAKAGEMRAKTGIAGASQAVSGTG